MNRSTGKSIAPCRINSGACACEKFITVKAGIIVQIVYILHLVTLKQIHFDTSTT